MSDTISPSEDQLLVEINPANEKLLKNCIYCQDILPSKTKEHIFNASWGGKAESRKLICDNCNQRFSESIDQSFKSFADIILNIWGMIPKRLGKVPIIHVNENYSIFPYHSLERTRLISDISKESNKYSLNVQARSKSEIKRFIDNGGLEDQIGKTLSLEKKKEIKSGLEFSLEPDVDANKLKVSGSIQLNLQYRSAMHTTLKTLVYFKPELFSRELFRAAINFIYKEEGDFEDFAISASEFMSTEIHAPLFSGVNIYFSKKYKKVIGVFNLLNRYQLAFALAEYSGKEDIMLRVSEGFNGSPRISGLFCKIPPHMNSLPLVEIRSSPISTKDIEENIRNFMIKTRYEDLKKVYSILSEKISNNK